jgi:hypothetical protein
MSAEPADVVLAREAYLALYAEVASHGDYLQTDSPERLALPDAILYATTGAVILKFFDGFVSRLGERASDAVVERLRVRRREVEQDPEAAVQTLLVLRLELSTAAAPTEGERREDERLIREELIVRGFSTETAAASSIRIVRIIRDRDPS